MRRNKNAEVNIIIAEEEGVDYVTVLLCGGTKPIKALTRVAETLAEANGE